MWRWFVSLLRPCQKTSAGLREAMAVGRQAHERLRANAVRQAIVSDTHREAIEHLAEGGHHLAADTLVVLDDLMDNMAKRYAQKNT